MAPKDLYDLSGDPTLRQLFNAFKGYNKKLEADMNLQWFLAKWSVLRSGMLDEKGQRMVEKENAPWDRDISDIKVSGTNYISYDAVKSTLDSISKT